MRRMQERVRLGEMVKREKGRRKWRGKRREKLWRKGRKRKETRKLSNNNSTRYKL